MAYRVETYRKCTGVITFVTYYWIDNLVFLLSYTPDPSISFFGSGRRKYHSSMFYYVLQWFILPFTFFIVVSYNKYLDLYLWFY